MTDFPIFNAATLGSPDTTTHIDSLDPPGEETHMRVHTIIIVIIFCVVCFLLLVAFFYAFCFHCTIAPVPKEGQSQAKCNLEREDATYRRSSSPSVVNSI